jgi:oligopeptide/dipeptide ABC transporter ATP-binding protein
MSPVLSVRELAVAYRSSAGDKRAVDGVSLELEPGASLCLVGESGSGKSTVALACLRLLASPPAIYAGGSVIFRDPELRPSTAGQAFDLVVQGEVDLLTCSRAVLRSVRGRHIGMVFQEPRASLDPVFSVGSQVAEVFRVHVGLSAAEARGRARALLVRLGIDSNRFGAFPHEISGGQCQRVMLAVALAAGPTVLIADEPTTGLDATVERRILDLLAELRAELHVSLLFVTHDLDVAAEIGGQLAVIFAGRLVEKGPAAAILEQGAALHPYTIELLSCREGRRHHHERAFESGPTISAATESSCCFFGRCRQATPACAAGRPQLVACGEGHEVACFAAFPGAR